MGERNSKGIPLDPSRVGMQKVIEEISKTDAYRGFLVDFTSFPTDVTLPPRYHFKKMIQSMVNELRRKGTHVFSLKIPACNGDIMEVAIDLGFRHHHANHNYSLLNFCLKGHKATECSYPPYRTISAGVTGVVFDQQLQKVLVVMEQIGVIKKFKPPTGGVDYGESQETPLQAVVRELKEETQIEVDPNKAFYVGTGWSNNYRGVNPDISYIFAFVLPEIKAPVAQDSEISKAVWMSVEEFIKEPPEEKEKPWLLRQAVVAALDAVKSGNSWKKQTLYLTTGKEVDFFSAQRRE